MFLKYNEIIFSWSNFIISFYVIHQQHTSTKYFILTENEEKENHENKYENFKMLEFYQKSFFMFIKDVTWKRLFNNK